MKLKDDLPTRLRIEDGLVGAATAAGFFDSSVSSAWLVVLPACWADETCSMRGGSEGSGRPVSTSTTSPMAVWME